jgi:hypothetical protein
MVPQKARRPDPGGSREPAFTDRLAGPISCVTKPPCPRVQPERAVQLAVLGQIRWRAPHVGVAHYPVGGRRSRILARLKSMGTKAAVPGLLVAILAMIRTTG